MDPYTPEPPAYADEAPVLARPAGSASLAATDSDARRLSGLTAGEAAAALGVVLVVAGLLPLVATFGIGITLGALQFEETAELMHLLALAEKGLGLVGGVGALAWLMIRHRLAAGAFGLVPRSIGLEVAWSIMPLFACLAPMLVTAAVLIPLAAQSPAIQEDLESRFEFAGQLPSGGWTLVVLLAVVALQEELFFRGLLLPLLRRLVGSWVMAVTIAAVLFGGLHVQQGVLAVFQITLLAVAFSVMFLLSRSLWPVVVAHFLFNWMMVHLMQFAAGLQQTPVPA